MNETLVAPTAASGEPGREVDRIRDIIFGAYMRDYEGRFEAVHRELVRLQGEIDQLQARLSAQGESQSGQLGDLGMELRKADEAIRQDLRATSDKLGDEKTDRAVLGRLLVQLGESLQGDGAAGA